MEPTNTKAPDDPKSLPEIVNDTSASTGQSVVELLPALSQPADPSTLVDCQTLAAWAGLTGVKPQTAPAGSTTEVANLVSPMQAVLAWAGAAPPDHYRELAMLTPLDWSTALASLTINGAPPSLADRGRAILFHNTARCLCQLQPWPTNAPTPPPTAPATPPAVVSAAGGAVASAAFG